MVLGKDDVIEKLGFRSWLPEGLIKLFGAKRGMKGRQGELGVKMLPQFDMTHNVAELLARSTTVKPTFLFNV